MVDEILDYAAFVDTAMRGAVRDILRQVERGGLPGQHQDDCQHAEVLVGPGDDDGGGDAGHGQRAARPRTDDGVHGILFRFR